MADDEMPFVPDRNDPGSNHVEYVGPFQRTYVVLNGFRVPRLRVGAETGDTVELILDDRWSHDIPKAIAEDVIALVANAIAVERGYACFPRSPDDWRMEKAPPFGAIWSAVDGAPQPETDGGRG